MHYSFCYNYFKPNKKQAEISSDFRALAIFNYSYTGQRGCGWLVLDVNDNVGSLKFNLPSGHLHNLVQFSCAEIGKYYCLIFENITGIFKVLNVSLNVSVLATVTGQSNGSHRVLADQQCSASRGLTASSRAPSRPKRLQTVGMGLKEVFQHVCHIVLRLI